MHWHNAYLTALSLGVFSSSSSSSSNTFASAFVTPKLTVTTSSSAWNSHRLRMVGNLGWDNENFLNSLGKGPEEIEKANEQYRKLSRFRPPVPGSEDDDDEPPMPPAPKSGDDLPSSDVQGAVLTDEMKRKMRESHESEEEAASQGGKLFREMMQKAQERAGGNANAPPPPQYPPQEAAYYPPVPPQQQQTPPPPQEQAYYPPPPPVPPQVPPPPGGALTVEQQAAMYREMMVRQAQQASAMGAFVPPPMPPPGGPAAASNAVVDRNRRIGRNRDADAVVNTSDVYFAQLKLDSSLRNLARFAGDDQTANDPFADPAIQEIKMHVNPYLEEMRAKEQSMLETATDEMLDLSIKGQEQTDRQLKRMEVYAGSTYKEKLMQKKKKGAVPAANVAPMAAAPAPKAVTPPPPPAPAAAVRTEEQTQIPLVPPAPTPPPVAAVTPSPPAAAAPVVSSSPSPAAAAAAAAAARQAATSTSASASASATKDESSTKRDIRTLMGLLLKHRGGPMFGSGRLQGADVERFEDLATQIMDVLQTETPKQKSTTGAVTAATAPPTSSSSSAISFTTASSASFGANVDGMMACIEGAIMMYKNSPPVLQQSVLITVRAAFVSAVSTLQELLEGQESSASLEELLASGASSGESQQPPVAERVQQLLVCVEGAIQMYKNSPPVLKESVLVTLRAALLSGIGTMNEISGSSSTTTTTAAPSKPKENVRDFVDVIPDEQQQQQSSSLSGQDVNAHFFEHVYDKLQQAAGTGVMGLRTDMTGEEAAALAEEIAQMRTLLVQELDSVILTTTSSSAPSSSSSGSSSSSKYQELLAKARADKNAKK